MSDHRLYVGAVIDALEECVRALLRGDLAMAVAWERVGWYRAMSAERLLMPLRVISPSGEAMVHGETP